MWSNNVPRGRALTALAFMGALVSGCAKAPEAEIDVADEALSAAVSAEAEVYAAPALASARDLRAQLDDELALQAEKWALTRSYDHATELAAQVKTVADAAANEAVASKEAVRQETATLLDEVKVAIDEVRTMLANAPTGKGSAVDLAALQADLVSAGVTLGEGENAFMEGQYMEAKSKLEATRAGIGSVKTAIETAAQARAIR